MKLTTNRYGIRRKGTNNLLAVEVSAHNAEFSTGLDARLELPSYNDPLYLATERTDAEATLAGVFWANAGLVRPTLGSFKAADLEIVEVTLTWEG